MYIFLLWSALGTLWHYLYDFMGHNYLVGLIAPVNESVWEHMKLAFFPGLIIYFIFKKRLKPALRPVITATWLIPVLFYTYSGILGFKVTFIDVCILFVSIGLSLFIKLHPKHTIFLYFLIALQLLAFLYFSYNPLNLGIFKIPE